MLKALLAMELRLKSDLLWHNISDNQFNRGLI